MKTKPNKTNRYIRLISKSVADLDATRAVEAFVRRFRLDAGDLDCLAARLGVSQIVHKCVPFEGAVSIDADGSAVITINTVSPVLRQRFTLAHEIGHLMLWRSLGHDVACAGNQELERACDAIAAELLMPTEAALPYVQNLSGPSPGNLRLIARRFDVSLHAAALRVHHDLRLWPQSMGLWQFDQIPDGGEPSASDGARECWFVGKRRWYTRRPLFRAFFEALRSSRAVRGWESYLEDGVMKPIALDVLHLGRGRLLGVLA